MDAGSGELLEDPVEAVVLWCSSLPGFGIAAPQDCDFVGLWVRITSVHATLLAWRVAQSLDGCLKGCLLDPVAILFTRSMADNPDRRLVSGQSDHADGRCLVR